MTTKAGAYIQDAWHYFDSVLGGDTFGREARSLKGRVELYEDGVENLAKAADAAYDGPGNPSSSLDRAYRAIENDLVRIDGIEDEKQLKEAARGARRLVTNLARSLNIDATTGETPEVSEPTRRRY